MRQAVLKKGFRLLKDERNYFLGRKIPSVDHFSEDDFLKSQCIWHWKEWFVSKIEKLIANFKTSFPSHFEGFFLKPKPENIFFKRTSSRNIKSNPIYFQKHDLSFHFWSTSHFRRLNGLLSSSNFYAFLSSDLLSPPFLTKMIKIKKSVWLTSQVFFYEMQNGNRSLLIFALFPLLFQSPFLLFSKENSISLRWDKMSH